MCIAQWAMHGQLLLPADEETLDKLARVSHSSIASHNWDEYISLSLSLPPGFPLFTSVLIGRKRLRGKGYNYLQESSSNLWVSHLNSCKNSLCKSNFFSDTLVKGEMDFFLIYLNETLTVFYLKILFSHLKWNKIKNRFEQSSYLKYKIVSLIMFKLVLKVKSKCVLKPDVNNWHVPPGGIPF